MKLSVVVCTYNPDEKILAMCLDSIARAAGIMPPHETIIVDNNSSPALSERESVKDLLRKVPGSRVIVEKEQGLTPARIRGIRESTGEVILYVDDDNILAPDYFEQGMRIASEFPFIGAWSGRVELVYERDPGSWIRKYEGMLVHRSFKGDHWSNQYTVDSTMPSGAGMFVRREVATYYTELHDNGKRRIQLDRKGSSLFSGGDNDMAACACDIGFGMGLFERLVLRHYIPEKRTTKEYMLRLAESIAASSVVFHSFRGEVPPALTAKNKLANRIRLMLKSGLDREFYAAVLKGREQGRRMLVD